MNKKKSLKPDDFFSAGPLQMARFGKNLVLQTNWPEGEFDKMQQKLVERFPTVVQEINAVIEKIAGLIRILPPEMLLYRAWGEMAVRHMNIESESDLDSDDALSLRMVDYIQSVMAGIEPDATLKDEVTEEDWQGLLSLVKDLFNKLNLDYQICRTAVAKKNNPDYDVELDEYYVKAQMYWCNVRGCRYLYHESIHITDLISSHSDILEELFGITAEQLIEEISKIQHALTRGIIDAGLELKEFQRVTTEALEKKIETVMDLNQETLPVLFAEVVKENGWETWQENVLGRFFGLDLFDLKKVTNLPEALFDELSWSQGQDTDFFADGDFIGWPLRVWPVFKRPFIKLNGHCYCFDLYSLLDNLYRVLQRTICRLKPDYGETWNRIQKETSEQLPFKYLEKLLPGAHVYHSVYYQWRIGSTGNTQWCESDGLLIYDDHLFIIEVKAGAFTYTSPAEDFPAYIESIKNLVLKPAMQGKRFIDYLNSEEKVVIYDKEHNAIGELSNRNFRHITVCTITLDPFTELAAQVQHLTKIGIDVGEHPVWSISLDDLRVYSDVFNNPLIFLHFVEQRMKAFASDVIQTDDELDHLGLYIKHNNYAQYASEMVPDTDTELNFHGYRTDIDSFFTEKLHDPNTPCPLQQGMPERLKEIIECVSLSEKSGRSKITCCSHEKRLQLATF